MAGSFFYYKCEKASALLHSSSQHDFADLFFSFEPNQLDLSVVMQYATISDTDFYRSQARIYALLSVFKYFEIIVIFGWEGKQKLQARMWKEKSRFYLYIASWCSWSTVNADLTERYFKCVHLICLLQALVLDILTNICS